MNNEKISSEKMSNEKISSEKISSEKMSNEKINSKIMSSERISKEKIAKEKIEKGQHYEAHQLIKSIINRKLQKNQVNSCMSIIFYFSQKLAKVEQYVLLCDLMYQCCTIFTQHNIGFNEEYAKKIIEIFKLCPPNSTEEKYKFMNKCILWSTNDDDIFGYLDFHKAIAYAYFEDKKYSLAHNHFLYLEDNEILHKIICLWRKEAYPSESDFFILRTTLCLLVLDKFEQALDLINRFEPNLDRKDVPLPIQISYLITCSCIYRSVPLYEDVKYKYRLILNYDPDFQKYIKILDDIVFNQRKGDLFSMFQNIFG